MKQHWQRISLKIDALSLRERAIIFGMAALILITLINAVLLDPQFAQQKQISQRIKQDQASIAGMQAQIVQKTSGQDVDPDKANKERLQSVRQQVDQLHASLRDMEKGLVSPDRMSALLEDILRQNNALRLVSLKTLSASPLLEETAAEEKLRESVLSAVKGKTELSPKAKPEIRAISETVYKHGVEIVVQGGYFDIMNYLAQLEAMPWHLFWSQAKLNVDYPKATLTLTLFTLSLEKKWLNL
jgi:MSHA biogenesis protein MshJ